MPPKPSFLEAGLPVASLSAECQRDNNARERPPQNRLHIWWARRPPTVCRAAILAALLPHDLNLSEHLLPAMVAEPTDTDLDNLPAKYCEHRAFFERLLGEVPPTDLTSSHRAFLRALGITGDADRAYRRMAFRENYKVNGSAILLPMNWTYRHPRAFAITPSSDLVQNLLDNMRQLFGLRGSEPVILLDSMAGGGAIPLEAIRYGLKAYANDLNPVSALVLKATLEYPAWFGRALRPVLEKYIGQIDERVRSRLLPFFYVEPPEVWWEAEAERATRKFTSRQVAQIGPAQQDSSKNCYFWIRTIPCPNCELSIPLSTNFFIVKKKGRPEQDLAAFPVVPRRRAGNDCTFRMVGREEWKDCRWPRMTEGESFHPTETPTFKGGSAICPRCGHVMDGDQVKAAARARTERGEGAGLAAQLYGVCAQVPVQLTYRNGEVKTRHLWRFRPPAQRDLDAVAEAERELARLRPAWEAQGLIPTELLPTDMEDTRPIEYGMPRWCDLFLPRQLLTNMTVLEEIRAAQARARAELPPDQAEAVNVYLAFILSKIVNYNSVNTFWHYGRGTAAQTFSRHDFAFRPAFCEFEGARETVLWGAKQVVGAYEALAGLIHGGPVSLEADDEEGEAAEEAEGTGEAEEAPEAEMQRGGEEEQGGEVTLRPEVIVPTITCEDAAALAEPAPGTVHLICVDPPYYNNVQYSELSNFFYVWLKRALRDEVGVAHLFREPQADSHREAVANGAHWQAEADREREAWQAAYDAALAYWRGQRVKVSQARAHAVETAGPKPPTAKDRADRFYEDKMAAVFRRARQLLHPRGRMVVMFNHKQTWAWRSLGMALIRAGFEIHSSVPIQTEAESSLNIRGLDAARSTILLLCQPRTETEQPVGNWATVQGQVARAATGAAERFQGQGLSGTDLYLSALGPALWAVSRSWPVTGYSGQEIDLEEALGTAYKAVGLWRLNQIFHGLTQHAGMANLGNGFSAEAVDRDTQALWLWLDTFQGALAGSDDVRNLSKSLNVEPDDFRHMGLMAVDKESFVLAAPTEVNLRRLARQLFTQNEMGRSEAREADQWETRTFPEFIGAAVWNGIALMAGTEDGRGVESLRRWLNQSGYGGQREFKGAFAVTLVLLESAFAGRAAEDPWGAAAHQARRAWDLVIKDLVV